MVPPARILDLNDEYDVGIKGPAAYPRGDQADEDKYATYVRSIFDEQRQALEPTYLTWTQNLLYLGGHQWWTYDVTTGTFVPPKPSKWRERPVRNLLKPFFRHFMAKAIKNKPVATCVPASSDPEDVESAQLGNDVLKAKWLELNMDRILRRLIAWLVPTGNAACMPFWNQNSGNLEPLMVEVEAQEHDAMMDGAPTGQMKMIQVPADENGEPIVDEFGNYDLQAEPHWIDIGDVGYRVLSPFQYFTDEGAECEEDMSFLVIVEALTLREIYRRYPDAIEKELVAEDTSELDRFDELLSTVASGADTHSVTTQRGRETDLPKAYLFHYYQRPDAEYPYGRHWVTCNQTVIEMPGPLPDGIWPPVVLFWDVDVAGQLHGDATMTDAVGLQREYNEICSQIKEHHNLLLRGKWLVPIGSNIRRGQITTQPGEVIQHTPGLPPVMADLKALPPKMYEERDRCLADFEFITSMHKISMGQPPPGVTSGRAFLTLQEADDSDLGPFIQMLENGVAKLGWLTIQLIQQFYDDERLIRIAGENRDYRVRSFRGADLDAIVDVQPQSGSAFPWNTVAKQNMMIDLAQTVPQIFLDPDTGQFDVERFRRLLPVGGEEAVGLASDLDVAEAKREEEAFELFAGEMDEVGNPMIPMVQEWQNHMVHARQHARVLKSTAFLKWPPQNQLMLIQHWAETQAKLMEMQMAMMESQAEEEGPDMSGNDRPPTRQSENEEAPSD